MSYFTNNDYTAAYQVNKFGEKKGNKLALNALES